jgi:Ca2+-binding RTX toxin-like protein
MKEFAMSYGNSKQKKTLRFLPRICALEPRYAPACTTTYLFLNVSVTCDSAADQIEVDGGSLGSAYTLTINGTQKLYKNLDGIAINAGGGNDVVRIMPNGRNLNGVRDPFTLDGGSGFDSVTLFDHLSPGGLEHVLTASTHQRTGTSVISYDNFETHVLHTSIALTTTVRIQGSAPLTTTRVNTGSAQDIFRIGSPANTLGTVQGTLFLNAGPTSDQLYVTDTGTTIPAIYTLANASFRRLGSAYISFDNINGITLSTGSGSDTINIEGVPMGVNSVHANGGSDTIIVGSPENTLDTIDGALWAYGGPGDDTLEIVDSQNPVPATYEVFQTILTRSGVPLMHYDSIQNTLLFAGQGDDVINIFETCCTNDSGATTVSAGGGNDVVNVTDPYFTLTSIWDPLTVWGGSGFNLLNLDDSGNTFGSTYAVTTTSLQRDVKPPIAHNEFQTVNLRTGSGNDLLGLANGAGLSGLVDAGGGEDVLDYSAFATDVVVNLLTGAATAIGGIAGVEHVIGGSGNDILVGDDGGNDLIGGGGRDVIIGGAEADTLDGGEGDDLLIGGSTSHDTSSDTLNSILASWTQPTPYNRRVRRVRPLLNAATVQADGAANNLNGQAGLDLFYLSALDTSDWNPAINEQAVFV